MNISRLIFSKETKEEIGKELNVSQRGKLRWERIKDAEASGKLNYAKNRYEVANIAGFTEETKSRGYQWVSNMIGRKHLQEVMQGFGKNGKMEYEYHVLSDPDYERENARKARMNTNKNKKNESVKPKGKVDTTITRGKTMFAILEKAAKDGSLAKAKNRKEIAKLVGYEKSREKSGYAWVSNLIYKGHIKESFVSVTGEGEPIYSYTLNGSAPNYDFRKEAENNAQVIHETPKEVEIVKEVEKNDATGAIKIKVSNERATVEVEINNVDEAIKLITTILKGE